MIVLFLAGLIASAPMQESPLSPESLRATVLKLASYNTRNTSTPELVEAASWVAEQFRAIPGASVEIMHYTVHPSPRVPAERDTVEVLATFAPNVTPRPGIVMMGGHLDSINMTGVDLFTGRAPGANDDGSGVAATLGVARLLASQPHSHPLVFVAFSGEEQGLLGSEALAKRAKSEGWKLDAVLSNDMIGNSRNLSGQSDSRHVRVFSEEKATHNSRELARWIEWLVRTSPNKGNDVKLVFRADRFGRGGDHSSFNAQGFTAVRLVDMHEEYSRQHTANDLPEAMDFGYLSRNAEDNALVLRSLANAGEPPATVRVDRRQSHDAHLSWRGSEGGHYIVYWRLTTEPTWTHWKDVGSAKEVTFEKLSKDDNVFAVGAAGGIPVVAN